MLLFWPKVSHDCSGTEIILTIYVLFFLFISDILMMLCIEKCDHLDRLSTFQNIIIGPIFDTRLNEKFLKSFKDVLCIHFPVCLSVCVCVCRCATEHTL